MKVSIINQYTKGLINKNCLQAMTQNLELRMDSGKGSNLEFVHKYIRESKFLVFLRKFLIRIYAPRHLESPTMNCRRVCFFLVFNKAYEFVIFTLSFSNCVICMWNDREWSAETTIAYHKFMWSLYIIDMFIKIFAGIRLYFTFAWNIFDFVLLAIGALNLCFLAPENVFDWAIHYVIISFRFMSILRLAHIISLIGILNRAIIRRIDVAINEQICFGYDLVKASADCAEEICQNFPQIIDTKMIRDFYRKEATEERIALLKVLELIQTERPWVATTVKTKQTIRQVLKAIRTMLTELKVSGYLDEIEYAFIIKDVFDKEKILRNMTYVEPCPPIVIFREVPWMLQDEPLIEFLHHKVQMVNWDVGDVVCSAGKYAKGVFIVISGLLRLSYQPAKQRHLGLLPIVDHIAHLQFHREFEDNITSGGTIGELAVLTNRPYNCTIVAEAKCVAYFLSTDIIREAFAMRKDPWIGFEARMWKCCIINLAEAILSDVPVYQSYNQDQVKLILETSFMVDVTKYRLFVVTEMIYDLILIEGVVVDEDSSEHFVAPIYIPRTTQKILISPGGKDIITRLLIIPAQDSTIKEIMDQEADLGDLMSGPIVTKTSSKKLSVAALKVDTMELPTKPSDTLFEYYWMPDKRVIPMDIDAPPYEEESVTSVLEAAAFLTKNKVIECSSSSHYSEDFETQNLFTFENVEQRRTSSE